MGGSSKKSAMKTTTATGGGGSIYSTGNRQKNVMLHGTRIEGHGERS